MASDLRGSQLRAGAQRAKRHAPGHRVGQGQSLALQTQILALLRDLGMGTSPFLGPCFPWSWQCARFERGCARVDGGREREGVGGLVGSRDPQTLAPCTLTFLQLPAGPPAQDMLECTHIRVHQVSSTWTPAHAC